MGSSVFHGGASTFLAISVLAFSDSYAFTVFFRTWIGIIVFGISNGFLLLPIILSEIGPLVQHGDRETNKVEVKKVEVVVGGGDVSRSSDSRT